MSTRSISFSLLRLGLAAGALIAASNLAHAQSSTLPELLVVSPSLQPIEASKVGSSVTVITGEQARNSGFSQLSDVLRTTPGVHVSQAGTRGTLTQLRVRGAEANHLLVVIDGVQVNSLTDNDFNFADFAMDDIERIELLRGPQSGLYGANAHSGVLTIVTKSGRGLTKPEISARVEGGTQRSGEGSATVRGGAGPFYGAATVTYGTTDGFNIARTGSERDGAKRTVATSKFGVDLTPYLNIEGFVRHTQRIAANDPSDSNFPSSGFILDRAGDVAYYSDTIGRVEGTLKLFDDRWIQSVKATSMRQNSSAYAPDAFGPNGLDFMSNGSAKTISYKSALLLDSMFAGGEKHRLTFLAENRREEFSYISQFTGPADTAFWRDGVTRTTTGLAGEYVLDLLATGTTVSAALRQDFNDPYEDEFTWRYSLSQKVAPIGGRLHASIGRGVTNPGYLELYGLFRTSFNFVGNPNLVPESSVGWDVGWEQTFWNGRVVLDVTYFSSRLKNEIVQVFSPVYTTRNLTGTSTREGVEATAKISPTDWLLLTATYTYTDSKDDQGNWELRRPRHSASGSASVLFDGGRGKVTANVVYNGIMRDNWFKTPSELVNLPAYTLVGGQISYDTTPWSTVYIRAENVFNRSYEDVFSYRAPGAAVYAGLKIKSFFEEPVRPPVISK